MSTEPLKISGELTADPDVCLFHLNRALAPEYTLVFTSAAEGHGSPLVDKLFAVGGLRRVTVSEGTIRVEKAVDTAWPLLANDVARAIREACAGEAPPLSPAAVEALKAAPLDGVAERITQLFEEQINPALAGHGGFVRLVRMEGPDALVEMGGGCQGCASARQTMRYGVEAAIRRVAPQVRRVIDATDHAAGANPYFA